MRRVALGLACFTVGCALLPALSRAVLNQETPLRVRPTAMLGVTQTKVLEFVPKSVRDPDYPHAAALDATGDTYGAAGLLQDSVSGFFLDELPDVHTFGTGQESAGANILTGVDMRIVGVDFGPGVPSTNLIQINYFSVDGSILVPIGSLSPDGSIFSTWRMDVGTTAAPPDQIEWTPNPGFTVVDSGFCLYNDGVSLGCFALVLDASGANGVAGVGAAGLGGDADIAGFPLDEMVLFWEIQMNSNCGDGTLDAGEECDDGNVIDGDLCSSTCTVQCGIDIDCDGDLDLADLAIIIKLMTGPGGP